MQNENCASLKKTVNVKGWLYAYTHCFRDRQHPPSRSLASSIVRHLRKLSDSILCSPVIPQNTLLNYCQRFPGKAKHLQFVSGVNFITYWTASAIWDYLLFIIPCGLCIICLAVSIITVCVLLNGVASIFLYLYFAVDIPPVPSKRKLNCIFSNLRNGRVGM